MVQLNNIIVIHLDYSDYIYLMHEINGILLFILIIIIQYDLYCNVLINIFRISFYSHNDLFSNHLLHHQQL